MSDSLADRLTQHVANFLAVVSGERANVDVDLGAVGDHVQLHAGAGHVRRERGARRRREHGCGPLRRAVQREWNGADPGVLIESSARRLEAGFTEQIVYLKPPDPLRTAESAAATLDE